MSLQSFPIVGLEKGLQTNVKPAMLPDQAWSQLENAFVWRERVLKREGTKLMGRLRRVLTNQSMGAVGTGSPYSGFFFIPSLLASEPDAQIVPGSVTLTLDPGGANQTVFKDTPKDGTVIRVSGPLTITAGSIDYDTRSPYGIGEVILMWTVVPASGTVAVADFSYYPSLPVMGIIQRELSDINDEQTVFLDTKYAYIYVAPNFQEYVAGTTWGGTDADLFWEYNYRGTAATTRLLYVTNFVKTDPIRYTNGTSWTTFAPLVLAASTMFQAKIIIPYYSRLLALNTWEGATAGGAAGSVNYYNRCRFSQVGDPLQADAWQTDVYGKGGWLDAPTDEAITGATFIKNTLVVDFERSTWQLRYVGEYGMPFVWERISADFGSESTFSGVLFDNHRLAIGDVGITAANGQEVNRIDLEIPDKVFDLKNKEGAAARVTGIRDYKKELVYWNYVDSPTDITGSTKFPNKVLVYNYRNATWAVFRDSITYFGEFYTPAESADFGVTWDSLVTYWDSNTVFWDDTGSKAQQGASAITVAGNQQGYCFSYGYLPGFSASALSANNDQESLQIKAISLVVSPILVTSPNHNLVTGELIYITGLLFINGLITTPITPVVTNLNNAIYRVTVKDTNTFTISKWDSTLKEYISNFAFTPLPASAHYYCGGGQIVVLPKMSIVTKDINIFQAQSAETKLSYLDFLFEPVKNGAVCIDIEANAPYRQANNTFALSGNKELQLSRPGTATNCQYSWFKFYYSLSAQYFYINITYDDTLMNDINTHCQPCALYGINAWCRQGGRSAMGG